MVNHTHAEPGNTFHESRTAQVGISHSLQEPQLYLPTYLDRGVFFGI